MTHETPAADQQPTPSVSNRDRTPTFWDRWGELLLALGVCAVGILVVIETQDIRVRQGVVVSPRIIPYIVGSGLILVSIWYAIEIIRSPRTGIAAGEDSEDVDPEARTDWTVIGIIAVALLAYTLLIGRAGFVIASTVLFCISAFAMGSRRILRDAAIGLVLSATIYLLFDGWLGVRLPAGWLEVLE